VPEVTGTWELKASLLFSTVYQLWLAQETQAKAFAA
jgi:hypothetical protein